MDSRRSHAWFGPWDPKKFYEMLKRNPEIKREEYEFVKSKAALLKDMGMMANRRGAFRTRATPCSVWKLKASRTTSRDQQRERCDWAQHAVEEVRRHAAVVFIGTICGPASSEPPIHCAKPSRLKAIRMKLWCSKGAGQCFRTVSRQFL